MFFATKVSFLGHNLSEEGILPDPDNVAKILNWPVPKTLRDVRGILGLGSYYHHFMRNFSESAATYRVDKERQTIQVD